MDLLVIAGFCAVACGMFYVWWQAGMRLHEFREKLYGDRYKLTTLFTYRPKQEKK